MNDNQASEIRRAHVRENRPEILRRWVRELLEDREALRAKAKELRAQVPPAEPISAGVVNDPRDRVESSK